MNRHEEILTILQEECAEVIQAVSKIKRFGTPENYTNLAKEMGDLQCMLNLMYEYEVVSCTLGDILNNISAKCQKLKIYSGIFNDQ